MPKLPAFRIQTLDELAASGAKFALFVVNDTEYWRKDIQRKAKEILTYSLVNLTQPTNLCSPEINYPTQEVYYRFKETEGFDEDELTTLERNVDDECRYLLEYTSVKVVRTWDEEETEEEIIEYLQGNPVEI